MNATLPLLSLLLSTFLALSCATNTSSTTGHCRSDEDCSLNGICDGVTCKCDKAWTGSSCEYLNFERASRTNGFRIKDAVTWGGSILPNDRPEGGYVAFASKMLNGCGLDSWTTNSAVVLATSASDPAGPYVDSGIMVAPPWAHNPQAIYIPAGDHTSLYFKGTYVLFTLGDGKPIHGPVKNCTAPSSSSSAAEMLHGSTERRRRHRRRRMRSADPSTNITVSFKMRYSTSGPLGPWKQQEALIHDFPSEYDFPGNWNPAPILLPDGRVRIVVHTNTPTTWSGEIIVEGSSWKGPYYPITRDITRCTKCAEDPFAWIDRRGHWHILYHKMFDPDDGGNNPIPSPGWTGGHSFSKDGIIWSSIRRAYNTTVVFEDGGSIELLRRERPKLVFAPDGVTPTHLSNGVIIEGGDTHTMVVPLHTPNSF